MKFIVYATIYSLIFCLQFVNGNEISFLQYCQNDSIPIKLAKDGVYSAGSVVMSSQLESGSWYFPNMNCSVTFITEENNYILLTFSNISLRNSSMDNLTVFYEDSNSDVVIAGQQVCSNENCEGLKFDSGQFNNLTLKFVSANVTVPSNYTGFIAHYTVYNLADHYTGACHGKNKFLCGNEHCIFYDFVCDGHNNCGDLSDETKCIIPIKNTVWGIVVIVIALIAIIIFVPLFLFLATYGTRSIVKSVTVPNQPTPLSNAADCGETSGLLTSSEAVNNTWPGTSYDSCNYGSALQAEPSANIETKKFRPSVSDNDLQVNKFL